MAEDRLPAVSEPNAKISAGGGALAGEPLYYLDGSVALPLGDQFGLQIDGLVGTLDDDGFAGGAGHVFWRDPSFALIGIYGSGFASTAGTDYTLANVGVEGALYMGAFSIEGTVGAQFSDELDNTAFGSATLAVYPIDDLRLYGGYRYWFEESSLAAGFEWQLPGQNDNSLNFALYGDARFRDDDEILGFGGVRIYFGSQKSLIRRHREDDPGPLLPEDLFIIERLLANTAAAAPPPVDGQCPGVIVDGVCVTEVRPVCPDGFFPSDGGCIPIDGLDIGFDTVQ